MDRASLIRYLSRDNVWVSLPKEWVDAINEGTVKSIRKKEEKES